MKVTDLEVVGHLMLVMDSEDNSRHPLDPSAQAAWKNQEGASRKMKSEVSEGGYTDVQRSGPVWDDTKSSLSQAPRGGCPRWGWDGPARWKKGVNWEPGPHPRTQAKAPEEPKLSTTPRPWKPSWPPSLLPATHT